MSEWEEYKFKIEAYTPATLPMARLAGYLSELAIVLGETPHVHLAGLEEGSVVIVNRVEREAAPKVKARALAIGRGEGSIAEMRAYKRINGMLKEDKGTGGITGSDGAEILNFPGGGRPEDQYSCIHQQGEINGEIIRVGGKEDIVPILLVSDGVQISGCSAKRPVAKDLAKHLFEPVRLFGSGSWERSGEEWRLARFSVDRFEVLGNEPLSGTVLALRGLKGDWNGGSLKEILDGRNPEGG